MANKIIINKVLHKGEETNLIFYDNTILDDKYLDLLKRVHQEDEFEYGSPMEYKDIKLKLKQNMLCNKEHYAREADTTLEKIYNRHKDNNYTLLIDGPRITGKTFEAEWFAKSHYEYVIEIRYLGLNIEEKSFKEVVNEQIRATHMLDYQEGKSAILIIDDIYPTADFEKIYNWIKFSDLALDKIIIVQYNMSTELREKFLADKNNYWTRFYPLTYGEASQIKDEDGNQAVSLEQYKKIGGYPMSIRHFLSMGERATMDYNNETVGQLFEAIGRHTESMALNHILAILKDEKISVSMFTENGFGHFKFQEYLENMLEQGLLINEKGELKLLDYSVYNYIMHKHFGIPNSDYIEAHASEHVRH